MVLFFEILLVAAVVVITWFALYALTAHHRRVVTSDDGAPSPAGFRRPGGCRGGRTGQDDRRPQHPGLRRPAGPADTANLREGADLNDALLALLPLVGVWRGEGEGRGCRRRLPVRPADRRLP